MRLSWDTRSRPEALGDSRAAIEAVETLRSLQDDAASSAELFSIWTLDYYWLSGRLLRDGREDEIDAAFSITERMRGRALLDQVTRLHHRRLDAAHPAVRQRRSLLEQIAGVQRRLMSTALTDAERQAALEDLEQLEAREQDARHQIAVASGGADVPAPAFATIGAVQSALGEGEALLSYQVGIWETFEGEFGGGSWVIVITRGSRKAYRLPDRGELAPLVPVFNGLLAREAEVSSAASARLYDEVIGQALRELPPGIDRLIVIPDGPLHRLPFDALHAAQDARPLAARYQLVAAPSATLWLRWHANTPPSSKRALSFADPEFTAATTAAANERNVVLQHGLRLGRLPHALRESRALRWHVSTSVDALVGREASEQALKQRDLRDYGVLHFAAHAFADESRPDRSAVLLAPGGGDEDGLLQAREIEELDLYGRVVVLSACRTASGAVLNGEGVLSLARAFFAAGARSVVGTRWPVGDADAAALFDVFYRALGRGATLADALQQAKLAAIEEGRPAAVWASLVLLGDGAVRPFHDESPPSTPRTLFIGGALSAMMALALAVKRLAPSSP